MGSEVVVGRIRGLTSKSYINENLIMKFDSKNIHMAHVIDYGLTTFPAGKRSHAHTYITRELLFSCTSTMAIAF